MKTIFEGKKLYAVIIAFLLIITFFITFYIIRNHYQYVFKNVITENTLTANLLSSLMYEHQKAATSILVSYAQRPLFIDAVKKKDFHRAFYHLKSLNEHHTEIDALFITDQYGTVWANYPVSKESYGKNLAYRDWYKGVSKKWRPYISTVFRLIVLKKDLAVAVSVPVLDRKGKVIGILGSTQRTLFLATFIKENTLDPKKSITLLDQEGNIIFSNAVPYQEKITKYPDARVLEKALAGVIIDMEIADAKEKGSISYVSIAPVKGIGWSVIVGQEKNAILKSLYGYFILSAVTGFVIFLFLVVSLLYFRKEYKYRKTKELLQAGVALRESERKYKELFERISSGVAVYEAVDGGEDFILLDFNAAGEAIEQVNREDIIGKRVTEVFPGVKEFGVFEVFQRVWKTGESEYFPERLYKDQHDTRTWRESWVYKLLGDEIVAVYNDITDRKRAEEALRQSNELFSLFMRHSPIYTYIKEVTPTQSVVLQASDNYRQMIGIPGSEMLGKTMTELFPPELAAKMNADDRAVVSRGDVMRIDDEEMNGRSYYSIKFPIVRGDKTFLAGYTIDITERKQAEEALWESEERYRTVARLSSEFAYSCIHAGDDGYEVNWITDAFFTLTGYSEAELHEQRCWLFVSHPDDREMATKPLHELKAGESDTREFRIVTKDGRVLYIINHMECQVDPKARGDLRLFGAVQDITERKRMEEEKRRLEERSHKLVDDVFRFIPEGVLVFSRKMELLRQNQAFRKLVSGYARRLGFAEDELENLIIDKVKAGLRDNNIKEIKIARKHETGEQT